MLFRTIPSEFDLKQWSCVGIENRMYIFPSGRWLVHISFCLFGVLVCLIVS
uniref:Uncharacterized protein n=1 Tax=Arundo donax TaxID=35708 RepID=A0A0A9FYV2_ARUDO